MSTLYTPPQYFQRGVIEGALTYKIPVSQTVYKLTGVWAVATSPSNIDGATVVINTPTVISDALATEIQAALPGVGTYT